MFATISFIVQRERKRGSSGRYGNVRGVYFSTMEGMLGCGDLLPALSLEPDHADAIVLDETCFKWSSNIDDEV